MSHVSRGVGRNVRDHAEGLHNTSSCDNHQSGVVTETPVLLPVNAVGLRASTLLANGMREKVCQSASGKSLTY